MVSRNPSDFDITDAIGRAEMQPAQESGKTHSWLALDVLARALNCQQLLVDGTTLIDASKAEPVSSEPQPELGTPHRAKNPKVFGTTATYGTKYKQLRPARVSFSMHMLIHVLSKVYTCLRKWHQALKYRIW